MRTVSGELLLSLQSLWRQRGDEILHRVADHYPELCTCYHPLFVFKPVRRSGTHFESGNVHSADGWHDVLEPVVARYRKRNMRRYFRTDAGFANPGVYESLEAEGYKYAIRLPANQVLQDRIVHPHLPAFCFSAPVASALLTPKESPPVEGPVT